MLAGISICQQRTWDRHLPYKAVLRSDLPYVDFVFDERLPETTIDRLSEKYGDWNEARSPRRSIFD